MELVLLIPAAIASGIFYWRILLAFKNGKLSKRKLTLTRAFFFLWVSWILCVVPYEAFDIYFLEDGGIYHLYIFKPEQLIEISNIIRTGVNDRYKRMLVVESCLRMLKFSYSFVNGLLLLILIRPFAKPIVAFFKTVKSRIHSLIQFCRWNSICRNKIGCLYSNCSSPLKQNVCELVFP